MSPSHRVGGRGAVAITLVALGAGAALWLAAPLPYPRVPASAPARVPRALYWGPNVVRNAPWTGDPAVRNVVAVAFRPGTPRAARQAAVDGIGGRVVGGRRAGDPSLGSYVLGGEGQYLVRVAGEPGACAVARAIVALGARPEVAGAWSEAVLPDAMVQDTLPAGPPPLVGVEDRGIRCGRVAFPDFPADALLRAALRAAAADTAAGPR